MEKGIVYPKLNDLPDPALQTILKNLSPVNLVELAQTCRSMHDAVGSPEVWQYMVFKTTEDMSSSDVARYLQRMPHLKNFVCQTEILDANTIIDTMVQYCRDIRSVDCSTNLKLDPVHISKLAFAFPNLESFSMHTYRQQYLLDILLTLSTLNNLKEMFFTFQMYDGSYSQQMFTRILGRGFRALQNLDLPQLHNAVSQRGIAYILLKKREQLKSLTAEFSIKTLPLIISRVIECTNLESLDLTLGSPRSPVNLEYLAKLRSLTIRIETVDGYNIFNNMVMRNPWPQLDQLIIRSGYGSSKRKLLSQIFCRFPRLQRLSLHYTECDSLNLQLTCIPRLSELKHLELVGYWSLTAKGLYYIAQCPKLEHLELVSCISLTNTSLEHLKSHPSLQKLILRDCPITGSTLISLVESLKCLKELTIQYCPYFDPQIANTLSGMVSKFTFIADDNVPKFDRWHLRWMFAEPFRRTL